MDLSALFKLSYGLFVLTARDGDKDNGCIINTAIQVTASPAKAAIAVNKANFTADMIGKTGRFCLSVLTESAPFGLFEQFGFCSGRDADKFAGCGYDTRVSGGLRYVPEFTNGVIAAVAAQSYDCGTHTMFIADVAETLVLSDAPSMTYQYYFDHVKPKPQPPQKKGYVCNVCGYVYEGDSLPADFICPLCKHGAADFKPL